MQLRLSFTTLVVAVLLSSILPSGASTNPDEPDNPADQPLAALHDEGGDVRWIDTELFSVQVPTSWKQIEGPELESTREQAERIAREMFPTDASQKPFERVLWLNAFTSNDVSTRLFLLISEIPPPAGAGRPYIESKVLGYADWQRSQAAVEKVRVSDIQELNGLPAVEVIFDLPEGATLYTVNLWTTVYRDRVGTVVAVANAGAVAQAHETIVRLVSTVKASKAVAEAGRQGTFRRWLRANFWAFEGNSPSIALVKRIVIVLFLFSLCFAASLQLLNESVLFWYRWQNMDDRVVEMASRAARDVMRLGYFYSQRLTLSCALLSMTLTSAALAWLVPP